MITREFNLYLHAGHSIPLVINCNQYDQGEQWLFTLFNADGTQYVPSSGAIVGIKSDNLGIINSGTVDSQGRVVINETQQMTAAVGKAVFELVIDDGTHGTANFVVLVEEKPGNNADLSETDISMIEQAIEAASTIKPYGSPLVASTVAGMTDHDKVYVYVGSETGYTSGHWYYYDGDSWEDGGVYNSVAVQTDTTLTLSGVAADAKKTGDEISDLKSEISSLEAIPHAVKLAMDNLFAKAVFKDDVTGDLATFHAWATAKKLLSISAVFEQGNHTITPYDSLDDLKQYLTVTANYDDSTSAVVSGYTLNGTLTEGTSTILVEFEGKIATFDVIVSWQYSFSYANGELTRVTGAVSNDSTYGLLLDDNMNRRSFFTNKGKASVKYKTNNNYSETNYYPIPVPPNATKWTCSVTPTTQFIAIKGSKYDTETNKYSWAYDSGWVQNSTINEFEAGTFEFIFITTKYNSSGNQYPTNPTEISVTFE